MRAVIKASSSAETYSCSILVCVSLRLFLSLRSPCPSSPVSAQLRGLQRRGPIDKGRDERKKRTIRQDRRQMIAGVVAVGYVAAGGRI